MPLKSWFIVIQITILAVKYLSFRTDYCRKTTYIQNYLYPPPATRVAHVYTVYCFTLIPPISMSKQYILIRFIPVQNKAGISFTTNLIRKHGFND